MTTTLVIQLDIDSLGRDDLGSTLKLVYDEACQTEYDRLWLSVATTRPDSTTMAEAYRVFGATSREACLVTRTKGFEEATLLFANAVGYCNQSSNIVIFDANRLEVAKRFVLADEATEDSTFYHLLQGLDESHRTQSMTKCLKQLQQALALMAHADAAIGAYVDGSIKPFLGFIKVYVQLLLRLSSRPVNNTPHGANRTLSHMKVAMAVAHEADRMQELYVRLPDTLKQVDFVRPVLSFFQFGRRSIQQLDHIVDDTEREGLAAFLAWCSAYFFGLATEEANRRNQDQSLLFSFRAFEMYLLSHLWRSARVDIVSGGFVLDGNTNPGFALLWREFREYADDSFVQRVRNRIEKIRDHRNQNILIHGFRFPRVSDVEDAKSIVRDVVLMWEDEYTRGTRLVRGSIGFLYRHERWEGNLGQRIAGHLLACTRP